MTDQRQYQDERTADSRAHVDTRVAMPLVVGAVAAVVSGIGITTRRPIVDEAATLSAVERSLPELWRMAHHIDGVHSTYYGLMHLWFEVVPLSVAALRVPSVLAVGLCAALLVVLVRRLADDRTAVVAGLVFAVLPRTGASGGIGRSYALSMTMAVLLTLVFVVAAQWTAAGRRRAWPMWGLYAVVALLSSYVFVYSVLMVAVHGIALLAGIAGYRRLVRSLLAWAGAAVVVGVLLVPFVRTTSGQASEELWWMGHAFRLDSAFWGHAGIEEYFGTSAPLAVVCGLATVAGLVAVAVGRRTAPELSTLVPRAGRRVRTGLPAVAVALPAVVVPLAAIVLASLLVRPLYNPRYLTFTAPFAAVLVALGVTAIRWRAGVVVAAALVVALAVPAAVTRWMPGTPDDSWAAVVADVQHGREVEPRGEVDGVVYGPLPVHAVRTTETIEKVSPATFRGMRDLTAERSAVDAGELWATRIPADRMPSTRGVRRIWYIGASDSRQLAVLQARLPGAGWHEDRPVVVAQRFDVVQFVRTRP